MSEFADLLLEAVKASENQDNHTPSIISTSNYHDSNIKISWLDTLADTATIGLPPRPTRSSPMTISSDYYATHERRPRAMSEPVTSEDSWATAMKIAHHHPTMPSIDEMSGPNMILPHVNEKYSSIYNKNGRVGLYTREERNAIIKKFHEKRMRRVWTKKIRYSCRKNLADRRVRVKGRFVKGAVNNTSSNAGDLIMPSSSHASSSSAMMKPASSTFVVNISKRRAPSSSSSSSSGNGLTAVALSQPYQQHHSQYHVNITERVDHQHRPRGETMTTNEIPSDEDQDYDIKDHHHDDMVSDNINLLAAAASSASSSSSSSSVTSKPRGSSDDNNTVDDSDHDDDDGPLDDESEEQFLRDFLSGKLTLPAHRQRRHTMA